MPHHDPCCPAALHRACTPWWTRDSCCSSHELPLLAPVLPVAVVVLCLDDGVDQDGHGKDVYANRTPHVPAEAAVLGEGPTSANHWM